MTEQEMFERLGVDLLARDREQAAKDLEYARKHVTFLGNWVVVYNVSSWNPLYGRFPMTGRQRLYGLSGKPTGGRGCHLPSDGAVTQNQRDKQRHNEYLKNWGKR